MVGCVEDRLLALAEARIGAMSLAEAVAGFDAAHGLLVEAQAVVLRYARQVEMLRAASKDSASSVAVWYRDRHRVGIRSAHRLARVAKRVAAAPDVVGAAVACGAVNLDQAEVVVFIDTDGLPTFIPPAHVDPLQSPRRNRYHRRQ